MTDPWVIHTLVFDLDDTLYPEGDYVLSGFAAAGRWLQKHRGAGRFAEAAAALFAAGRRGKIFDEALPMVGVDPKPELVRELLTVYRDHVPVLAPYEDAADILAWAGGGFRLGLITDGYAAVQARKIRALELESRISCRVITDEIGREFWKPSEEPYRRVMAQHSGPADGFVYVADNPRKDFIGAKALGWRTVRVRRLRGEHSAYEASSVEAAEIEMPDLGHLRTLLVADKP